MKIVIAAKRRTENTFTPPPPTARLKRVTGKGPNSEPKTGKNSTFADKNTSFIDKNDRLVGKNNVLETYLVERREPGIRIAFVTGILAKLSDKGCWMRHSAAVSNETPSVHPEYLRKSFYIMKNAVIEFDYGSSGKKGNRGPPVQALIP
jgi:hypothetical protein